jgi:hypothetical protein
MRDDNGVGTLANDTKKLNEAIQAIGSKRLHEAERKLQDLEGEILRAPHSLSHKLLLPQIRALLNEVTSITRGFARTNEAVLDIDVISSKKLASEPGGHARLLQVCGQMRLFVEHSIEEHDADQTVSISPLESKGDNVAYRLVASNLEAIADLSLGISIAALTSVTLGRRFRYVIYRLEAGLVYQPRIKVFEDITKTREGKNHHIAVERGLVTSVTSTRVLKWLRQAPHVAKEVRFQGEPITGLRVDFYENVRGPGYRQAS